MRRKCFTSEIKDEKGSVLIAVVFLLMIVVMVALTMVTLSVADTRLGLFHAEERRAFYSAESGLEYATKKILTMDPTQLHDWTETIETGSGTTCDLSVSFQSGDRVQIEAHGKSAKFVKKLRKEISYIDISQYAIYTSGTVSKTVAHEWPPNSIFYIPNDPSLVYQNAAVMPRFDLDSLRELSKPNGYHAGDYTVNSLFNFPSNKLEFVEGDLTFQHWNWMGWGYFTVMGQVNARGPWLPFTTTAGIVYQPVKGKVFRSQWSLLRRSFIGGLITNGNIQGAGWLLGRKNLYIFHKRSTIINFMRYSVNGGPLLVLRSRWENLN